MHMDLGNLSNNKIKELEKEGKMFLRLEMKQQGIKNVPELNGD